MPRKRHRDASSVLNSNLQLLAPSPASARVMASFASDFTSSGNAHEPMPIRVAAGLRFAGHSLWISAAPSIDAVGGDLLSVAMAYALVGEALFGHHRG
jgi:hypothetical protein